MPGIFERALACAVCFGPTDAPMAQGLEWSIVFMIGLTYGLIGGGAGFVIWRRRQAQKAE